MKYVLVIIGVIALCVLVVIGLSRPNTTDSADIKTEQQKAKREETIAMQHKTWDKPPEMQIDASKKYEAILETSKGTMRIALNPQDAPMTVNNFVFLAREHFYDNTIFHRIIEGFMIQGGDPEGTGRGGPGYRFADEPIAKSYTRGTIAMANAGPNTNGSQFFIMHKDYPLPKNYVIFGSILSTDTQSLQTLDTIATSAVVDGGMGEKSKPVETITVKSVMIEER
jgi:cyclophilin family peptidyl-prolyl cis-trans isomerase